MDALSSPSSASQQQRLLNYWRSLSHQDCPDPRLYPGMLDELRAALRDAVYLLEIQRRQNRSCERQWSC